MTEKTIILFNGPPSSGKDTSANHMLEVFGTELAVKESMAWPLKQANRGFFQLTDKEYVHYDQNAEAKNLKCDRFLGSSWRQVNIDLSEEYLKSKFGKSVFGELASQRIKKLAQQIILISDSGFLVEVEPLIRDFGSKNIIHLKLNRPGFDYSIDSRSYLDLTSFGIVPVELNNDGSVSEYISKSSGLIQKLVKNK